MSTIAQGFKLGNIVINKQNVMTANEMQSLGDAAGYPDVFPIWCTDDNSLYIYYKSTDGIPNIVNFNNLVDSTQKVVLYPVINPTTSQISWEIRQLTDAVPDPVILKGIAGPSAYQAWLDLGHTGTEQNFIDSLKPDLENLTSSQIASLKVSLGINDIETAIQNLNNTLNSIIS